MQGSNLAGAAGIRGRVENDFYATPFESTRALIGVENIYGDVLEPCVGQGHIANELKHLKGVKNVTGIDLIDRKYPNTIVTDFLEFETDKKFDWIITNPPYRLAQSFIEHSLDLLNDGGKCAFFLKIQFLEGVGRKDFFKHFPPKRIHVFSKRQNPWRNGMRFDENGKKWNSTMCFSWFVWEKDCTTLPIIDWI